MLYDIIIKNGCVIDGSSGNGEYLDIGIKGDEIVYSGKSDPKAYANHIIDASGCFVSPGFIDVHSHGDFFWAINPRSDSKIYDGVTTEICGNCGSSPFPLRGRLLEHRRAGFSKYNLDINWQSPDEFFRIAETRPGSINRGFLVGHGNLRACVVGYDNRPANKKDLETMKKDLVMALNAGAFGLSTGLAYPPGCYAPVEELIEMCRIVKGFGRIFTTHIRNEGDSLEESILEAVNIAKKTDIDLHISHLKTAGKRNWHKLDNIERILNQTQKEGVKVTADRYPYIASSTDLDAIFPKWVFEGGIDKEIERLKDKAIRNKIRDELTRDGKDTDEFWKGIMVSFVSHPHNKGLEGKIIWEIAKDRGKPSFDTVCDLLIEEDGRVDSLFFNMSEKNLERILRWDLVMIASDSSSRSINGPLSEGRPHPRSYGTFCRVLGMYCREKGLLTFEDAIYKMTGLPAKRFGIAKRGLLRPGYYADIVVFDGRRVKDMAEFHDPHRYSTGIMYVIVNGKVTIADGRHTGAMHGRILRRDRN